MGGQCNQLAPSPKIPGLVPNVGRIICYYYYYCGACNKNQKNIGTNAYSFPSGSLHSVFKSHEGQLGLLGQRNKIPELGLKISTYTLLWIRNHYYCCCCRYCLSSELVETIMAPEWILNGVFCMVPYDQIWKPSTNSTFQTCNFLLKSALMVCVLVVWWNMYQQYNRDQFHQLSPSSSTYLQPICPFTQFPAKQNFRLYSSSLWLCPRKK